MAYGWDMFCDYFEFWNIAHSFNHYFFFISWFLTHSNVLPWFSLQWGSIPFNIAGAWLPHDITYLHSATEQEEGKGKKKRNLVGLYLDITLTEPWWPHLRLEDKQAIIIKPKMNRREEEEEKIQQD